MNYSSTLEFLYSRLPMFSRIGIAAYKKDLINTIRICEFLGNPEKKFLSIHVAGTNGKGSVTHMLAAIFQSAGYRTGLYTSPHLKDFRERIRVNGEMVDEEFVIAEVEKLKPLIEEIRPSFFEITVGLAFKYFADRQVDIALIETGLGGRLDSTNVISPVISVITNIGLDHANILGDTRELIAIEKAGIIKPGIPVVIGERDTVTDPLFTRIASGMNSRIYFAQDHFSIAEWKWEKEKLKVEIAEKGKTDHLKYDLDLTGIYQLKNLLTVLKTANILKKDFSRLDEGSIRKGLSGVKKLTGLHGRWEIINRDPLVILDVAHNREGLNLVKEQIEIIDHNELHIIFGMVNDKDPELVIPALPPNARYYFTQADIPRALDSDKLRGLAEQFGIRGKSYPNVNIALDEAMMHAKKNDLILICGSLFLVGEVQKNLVSLGTGSISRV